MKIFLYFFIVILVLPGYSQQIEFSVFADSLKKYRLTTINSKTDVEKLKNNASFHLLLKQTLTTEGSFNFGFDSVPYTGFLLSPDNKFRIINWNLEMNDKTHQYFCFILYKNKKTKKYELLELADKSSEYTNPEYKMLDATKWFGCLYYQIIPLKDGKNKFYTLLGWDGNDNISTKKIVEVMKFSENGNIQFGADVFKMEGKPKRRIIFEYAEEAVMSVKYHEKRKEIVFDHLSPSSPELEGAYQYYGPDMTYDALQLKKGKWHYVSDVNIKGDVDAIYNPKAPKNEKKIYGNEK